MERVGEMNKIKRLMSHIVFFCQKIDVLFCKFCKSVVGRKSHPSKSLRGSLGRNRKINQLFLHFLLFGGSKGKWMSTHCIFQSRKHDKVAQKVMTQCL